MKYFLIAGEASGDLHASNLMAALKKQDAEADFRFLGGDLMQAVGGTLVKHYRDMAFMGFIPVLLNLRTILNNMKACQEEIRQYRPDVVILIDYPGQTRRSFSAITLLRRPLKLNCIPVTPIRTASPR